MEYTYEENQSKWIKDNNIKIGDSVKIIRSWTNEEALKEGCIPPGNMSDDMFKAILGVVGVVKEISSAFIAIDFEYASNWFYVPYFVLEKVNESRYVPFDLSKEEDINILCQKSWVKSKLFNTRHIITEINEKFVCLDDLCFLASDFLEKFVFLDDTPCGKII